MVITFFLQKELNELMENPEALLPEETQI